MSNTRSQAHHGQNLHINTTRTATKSRHYNRNFKIAPEPPGEGGPTTSYRYKIVTTKMAIFYNVTVGIGKKSYDGKVVRGYDVRSASNIYIIMKYCPLLHSANPHMMQ